MGVPVIDTGPFTVEEFYDFTDARPDGEKWELIDGELVLNASPAYLHQRTVGNLVASLTLQSRDSNETWFVIPGIGALVSNTSRPEPDVMVLPSRAVPDSNARDTRDAVVLFEVASPSTSDRDLKWKRSAYTGMPALTHYVVVAQDAVDVVVFDRTREFNEQRPSRLTDKLDIPVLGISLPLSEIYRGTGLA